MADPGNRRRADSRRGLWIFAASVLVWLLLAFPYAEATRNANENPRLVQAMALVDGGTFAIDGPEARDVPLGPDLARNPETGRIYPNKPPGTSFLMAGAYAGARAVHGDDLTLRRYTHAARVVVGIVPTTLLCLVLVARYRWRFGFWPAVAAALVYVAGTPAASYAHLAYGHQLAACLLALGVAALADARDAGRLDLGFLGGLFAGAAVAVDYAVVFAAIPIALLLLSGSSAGRSLRVSLAALGGALIPVALLMAYHQVAFGSALSTGYHHVINETFASKHSVGLLGLTAPTLDGLRRHLWSPDGGLLWWFPGLVLAGFGLFRQAFSVGSLRSEARLHLALLVGYIGLAASLSFDGGWRVGPRYVVAVLPGVVLGLCEVIVLARERRWLAWVLGGVCAHGVVVNSLAASLWPHFDLTRINQPVAEVLLPLWEAGYEPYGVLHALDLSGTVGLVVAVAAAALAGSLVASLRPGVGGALSILVAVGAGVLSVAATRLVEPHPQGPANLRYIMRTFEPAVGRPPPVSQRLGDPGPG